MDPGQAILPTACLAGGIGALVEGEEIAAGHVVVEGDTHAAASALIRPCLRRAAIGGGGRGAEQVADLGL